jgi:hypothetical protein
MSYDNNMRGATHPLDPFDLIIDPSQHGLVIIDMKLGVGLDQLAEKLLDREAGRASTVMCGGCAKDLLAPILDQPPPGVVIVRTTANGKMFFMDTADKRHELLAMLGEHVH